ncbi:hypothetical protein NDU88_001020 [Pleurodeles waltl]|uniref:Uncharacterized protein n=1 Tax=Pleurodeles waltl TaxID=8319 RepID=A0AAV7V7C1_PLEWA|nr:hypothetical protein NDU88_001020 [Pleurodeles waltl]
MTDYARGACWKGETPEERQEETQKGERRTLGCRKTSDHGGTEDIEHRGPGRKRKGARRTRTPPRGSIRYVPT